MNKLMFLAVCLLIVLQGCGGGEDNITSVNYQLQGTVYNLSGNVSIEDGLGNSKTISANGPFSFSSNSYLADVSYNVTISNQPDNGRCRVVRGEGQFIDSNVVNIEIRCSDTVAQPNLCAHPVGEAGASYELIDTTIAYGSGLGAAGFSQFDTDNDDYPEILFGTGYSFGPNTSFIIMEYDETSGQYQSLCQSVKYSNSITKISPFGNRSFNNGTLVVLANGDIEVIDHSLGQKVATIHTGNDTGSSAILDLLVGDVDNDGNDEIAILTSSRIYLYDSDTYESDGVINYGGDSFAMGKFKGTGKIQIAINSGLVLEHAGNSTSVIWDYQILAFGDTFVSAGDVDGDGLDEIVAGDRWYNITVFNADLGGIQWELNPGLDIDALEAVDTNGDNVAEVIYSDGQHGSTYVLNGVDGVEITSFPNNHSGTTNLLVDDFDNDTNLELAWGVGYGTTGADYLQIADLSLNQLDWTSPDDEREVTTVLFADINNDTVPDRLSATFESQSGYADGLITAIDGVTGNLIWKTTPSTFGGNALTGLHALAMADVTNDGTAELLVGTDRLYDGYVYAVDVNDGTVIKQLALDSGSPIYSLKVDDIDGDGKVDILAGGGKEHTGSPGVFVYVIDPETFMLKSTLPSLGNNWPDLWVLDTVDWDGDNNKDVLALWDGAYIFDPEINAINRTVTQNYTAMGIVGQSVYLATSSGTIEQLNGDTSTVSVDTLCNDAILSIEPVTADQLAFTCGGRLGLYTISTSTVAWQTGVVDQNLGLNDSLRHTYVEGVSSLLMSGNVSYYFQLK